MPIFMDIDTNVSKKHTASIFWAEDGLPEALRSCETFRSTRVNNHHHHDHVQPRRTPFMILIATPKTAAEILQVKREGNFIIIGLDAFKVQEGPYLFPHWTGSCEK
jgi:hypothetical protein